MPDTLPCKPAMWLGCTMVQTTRDVAGIVVHKYEAFHRIAAGVLGECPRQVVARCSRCVNEESTHVRIQYPAESPVRRRRRESHRGPESGRIRASSPTSTSRRRSRPSSVSSAGRTASSARATPRSPTAPIEADPDVGLLLPVQRGRARRGGWNHNRGVHGSRGRLAAGRQSGGACPWQGGAGASAAGARKPRGLTPSVVRTRDALTRRP